jgi:amino acid transporter
MPNPVPTADDAPPPLAKSSAELLPRRLGVFGLVMLIVAFNAPVAAMAGFQQLSIGLGNGLGAPSTFIIAGVILMIFAVGFVAMSKHSPNPGAYYRYIVDGLGRPAGLAGAFLATISYLVFMPGTLIYLGLIFVDMTTRLTGDAIGTWQLWALVSVGILTVLGLLRIDLSMKVLGTLVIVECVVVALWEGAILIKGGPDGHVTQSFSGSEIFSGSIGLAVLFAMLTMIGIESAACFRDETRDPDRSVGRATFIGIGFLMVFYAIGSWVYIISQGSSDVVKQAQTDPVGSFFNSVDSYLGSVFVDLVAIVLVTSQLAASNSLLGMSSRYLHALGRDRVLPKQFAKVHPKLQSPFVAVGVVMGISLVALLASIATDVDVIAAYAAMTGVGIYLLLPLLMLTSLAVIVYFRRHPDLNSNPWPTLIAPALSIVALAVLFVLVTKNLQILTATSGGATIAKISVVVIPVMGFALALWFRSRKPEVYETIGNPLG